MLCHSSAASSELVRICHDLVVSAALDECGSASHVVDVECCVHLLDGGVNAIDSKLGINTDLGEILTNALATLLWVHHELVNEANCISSWACLEPVATTDLTRDETHELVATECTPDCCLSGGDSSKMLADRAIRDEVVGCATMCLVELKEALRVVGSLDGSVSDALEAPRIAVLSWQIVLGQLGSSVLRWHKLCDSCVAIAECISISAHLVVVATLDESGTAADVLLVKCSVHLLDARLDTENAQLRINRDLCQMLSDALASHFGVDNELVDEASGILSGTGLEPIATTIFARDQAHHLGVVESSPDCCLASLDSTKVFTNWAVRNEVVRGASIGLVELEELLWVVG